MVHVLIVLMILIHLLAVVVATVPVTSIPGGIAVNSATVVSDRTQ